MEGIAIGFIRTTHGVRGLLKVESYSGDLDHFLDLKKVVLRKDKAERIFSVERIESYGKGLLFKLQGIDSPEVGKQFSNWEIWVDRSQASELQKDEFYHADLCGAALLFHGENLGTVKSVITGGNGDLLEVVLKESGETKLIPFRKEFIGRVDSDAGEIDLLEDWILE